MPSWTQIFARRDGGGREKVMCLIDMNWWGLVIILSLSLESDEGSANLYDDPELESESKETGKDYLDNLYDDDDYSDEDGDTKNASDGKIVVVTEKTQDADSVGNDYMEQYGRSDPDPPSFDGMELANDDTHDDDDHFADLNL